MADRLLYLTGDDTERNEFRFINGILSGIPSSPAKFFLKNESVNNRFEGNLFVSPAQEGRSYSDDLYIAIDDPLGQDVWLKSLLIDILPEEKLALKARVIPRSTPQGTEGSATILALGDWKAV